MEKSIQSIGSNLKYMQEKLNIISNNIANSSTKGYKKDTVVGQEFSSLLVNKTSNSHYLSAPNMLLKTYSPPSVTHGVKFDKVYTSFSKGALVETGDNRDIALAGTGFLVVNSQQGDRYLTCASTTLDEDGFLAVPSLGRIRGTKGDIAVGSQEYSIKQDGSVYVEGKLIDKILVVDMLDLNLLVKEGNGSFTTEQSNVVELVEEELLMKAEDSSLVVDQNTGEPGKVVVLQGFLEESNVNLTDEMTDLMQVSTTFETSQRTVQILDEIYGVAINKVGRV